MNISRITSKGQTTIPLEIRRALGVSSHDSLIYELRDGEVVLRPLKGNLLEFRGSIRRAAGGVQDLAKVRQAVIRSVAKRAVSRGR
ncbi:MAG: AbrB/MazE/SpoVT family DNA-binding domain-containing protein [Candidatus Sumerlaeaceae bacterium]